MHCAARHTIADTSQHSCVYIRPWLAVLPSARGDSLSRDGRTGRRAAFDRTDDATAQEGYMTHNDRQLDLEGGLTGGLTIVVN